MSFTVTLPFLYCSSRCIMSASQVASLGKGNNRAANTWPTLCTCRLPRTHGHGDLGLVVVRPGVCVLHVCPRDPPEQHRRLVGELRMETSEEGDEYLARQGYL
jgi:hypothetical protein